MREAWTSFEDRGTPKYKQGYETNNAPDADPDQGDDYEAILSREGNDALDVDDVHPETSIVHFDGDVSI